MSKREELTERDRDRLDQKGERKALRVIDAHAADRAALEARVAELEREMRQSHRVSENAIRARDADAAEVTRLREDALAEKREANAAFCLEVQLRQAAEARAAELEWEVADKRAAESEVLRLREELAAAERACDAAIAGNTISTQHARDAEQRADDIGRMGKEHIEQLRGLLENEEKNHAFTKSECAKERGELLKQCDLLRGERGAAEARVAELNERLAAANALLGRIPVCLLTDCPVYADLMAHLSALRDSK